MTMWIYEVETVLSDIGNNRPVKIALRTKRFDRDEFNYRNEAMCYKTVYWIDF
jgi:hypothetical protein